MKFTTTSSITNPISLATAKSFLRVSNTADDTLINILLDAAHESIEGFTNRVLSSRTMTLDTSDISNDEYYPYIHIKRSPITSIDNVQVYYNNTLTDVPSASYRADISNNFTKIYFINSVDYDDDVTLPFKISFTIGYSTCPNALQLAILQYVSYLYENRGDTVSEGNLVIPREIWSVINQYRLVSYI